MDLKIYYDVINKVLLAGADGGVTDFRPVVQGDTPRVVLQGIEPLENGDYRKVPTPFDTIKLGIGFIDAPPLSGSWKVRVDGVSTAALGYNIGKQALEAKLNALSTVIARGGLTVIQSGASNIYFVRWNNPAVTTPIEIIEAQLFPKCFTRVTTWNIEIGLVFIIKLFQAPVAFTDQFALPLPPAVTRERVRMGTGTRNEVQRITVPVDSVGEFSITWSGLTTAILPVLNVTFGQIQTALNDIYSDGVQRFKVTQPSARYFYVEFVGPLEKAEQPLIVINMENQPVLETPVAELSLKGPGVEIALGGKPEQQMMIELVIINGGNESTPLQAPIKVLNDMIDSEMAIENDPAWLEQQLDPVAWLDHDHSQVIYGEQHYAAIVGDGVLSAFVATHNLGTKRLHVTVWENGGTELRIPDNTYETKALNDNQLRITFPEGAPDLNAYIVYISSIGPSSYFLGHNHTIAEIIGLQDALDALTAAANPLDLWPSIPVDKLPAIIPWDRIGGTSTIPDSRIPSNIPRLNSENKLLIENIPLGIPRVDGDTGQLVYWGIGPDGEPVKRVLADANGSIVIDAIPNRDTPEQIKMTIPDFEELIPALIVKPGKPDRFGALLRAVKQAVPVNLNTVMTDGELNEAGANASKVGQWVEAVENVYAPGGPLRKGVLLTRENAPYVACDGAYWFGAEKWGDTYYPREMNRELSDAYVSADMLASGTYFEIAWTLLAQLLGIRRAQYMFTVKLGTLVAAGDGMGPNIASVNFNTVLFEKPITLTEAEVQHSFAYRVRRPSAEVLDAETREYLKWIAGATAPAAASFAIRAELNRFDTEDPTADLGFGGFSGNNASPVGQLKLSCKTKATISTL